MAMNEVSGTVTLDSLFSRVGELMEQANLNANLSFSISDEVCGSTPTADEVRGDSPRGGKLEMLRQMLDTLGADLTRDRVNLRRLQNHLCTTGIETAQSVSVGKSAVDRY